MPKKKRKRKKAPQRRNTPLSKHQQVGKVLNSPFGGIPNMRAVPWLRDQFPDYLWVCWHLAADLDSGRTFLVATMDRLNQVLDEVLGNTPADRAVFDGSLTSWELLSTETREPILESLVARGLYDQVIPEDFAQALGMYPDAPGTWLLGPWRELNEFRIDPATAERALGAVIVAGMGGRDAVATQAKMLNFRAVITADKIRFADGIDTLKLLPLWPDGLTDDERARVESFVRAGFGATSSLLLDDDESQRLVWARRFWRSNWRVYACRVSDDEGEALDEASIREALASYLDRVSTQWEIFEAAAVRADPDLYDPDRYEVLSGLAARSLRLVSSAVQSPAEWTPEHSPAKIRALIETLITITWLTERENPIMYARFKDYGRGRLKLLKLHWEEFADSLDDEVPSEVQGTIDDLDRMVNQDISEEFQNIDLGGTFSGLDTRKMAYEVGLEREYRLGFAPSSSDAHGEWGHLDRYALTRCLNPTHRWHRVPRQSIMPAVNSRVIETMLDLADRVIERYTATVVRPAEDRRGGSTESRDKSVPTDDQAGE